jgi:endonuclease/exonuclease/phosphatase family metal-dependent hydrolase
LSLSSNRSRLFQVLFFLLLTCLFSFSVYSQNGSANAPAGGRTSSSNPPHELLETGAPARRRSLNSSAVVPSEIRILSYNIRYRGGEDLQRLIELFRSHPEIGGANLIGLQEVDRNTRRVGGVNTARVIAEALEMHYAWAAPPRSSPRQTEDETGVTILSQYPLTNVERLILPNPGPGGRRRVAVGATALLPNGVRIRFYSVHAETRLPHEEKMQQYRAVLDHALRTSANNERIVILGDFNTIRGRAVRDTRQMFTEAGFSTPFSDDEETWRFSFVRLKLDWLWLRGFGSVAESGIARRIELSDHWPLWARVRMN